MQNCSRNLTTDSNTIQSWESLRSCTWKEADTLLHSPVAQQEQQLEKMQLADVLCLFTIPGWKLSYDHGEVGGNSSKRN